MDSRGKRFRQGKNNFTSLKTHPKFLLKRLTLASLTGIQTGKFLPVPVSGHLEV
jgi:hypothetical protein